MDTWPRNIFGPTSERWSRSGRLISGGPSLSGIVGVGRTDGGGFWVCEQSGIYLNKRDRFKAWRAWETIAGDGVTQFIVPGCECRFAPYPTGGAPAEGIPHSDETLFSDEAGYEQGAIQAAVSGAAALRATQLAIAMTLGAPLEGGEVFSIDHPVLLTRRYAVGRVLSTAGAIQTVTIWPPLRQALAGGEVANFDNPGCTMRVADPAAFASSLDQGRFATASVTFVEAF